MASSPRFAKALSLRTVSSDGGRSSSGIGRAFAESCFEYPLPSKSEVTYINVSREPCMRRIGVFVIMTKCLGGEGGNKFGVEREIEGLENQTVTYQSQTVEPSQVVLTELNTSAKILHRSVKAPRQSFCTRGACIDVQNFTQSSMNLGRVNYHLPTRGRRVVMGQSYIPSIGRYQ